MMEQLAILNYLVGVLILCCVGYCGLQIIGWIFSLFGGLCIGC
jgi:hypothetical protein